ncbi:ribonuclease H-like protein [Ephemerocybe angulata]|uniref:ribonuclease H n=1 Tax=Ephemerocybe angulata TaxID=980116 RepID=A0A8H6M6R7_9AGAR|nr:ribonuclease H-like protein [Tulosesus angulatus]
MNEQVREQTEAYTDGSCHNNGTDSAQCGSGVWYGERDERNKATRIGNPHPQTNNTGELVAVLLAIQNNKNTKRLVISSDSQYTINAITSRARPWADKGYEGVANQDIVRAIAGEILRTKTTLYTRKVKGHSGDLGNDGADALANVGAMKPTADTIDLSLGEEVKAIGARANSLTQASAYRMIRQKKKHGDRRRTAAQIEKTKAAVLGATGVEPKKEAIWKSLRKRKKGTLTQKFSAFAWKSLHEGYKVGKYWRHITEDRLRCQPCNADVESMNHIMHECRVSGQETVWRLAQEAWAHTGIQWPEVTFDLILGIGTVEVKGSDGKIKDGRTRLFQILITESAYLIWILRCEWRIAREQNTAQIHTAQEIEARWRKAITRRLRLDWALTSKLSFGKRALRAAEVKRTWNGLSDDDKFGSLRKSAAGEGVLVGSTTGRRPPGRNR